MQARNETLTGGQDVQSGPVEPTTRERTPRFKLIKLEERIAPGGVAPDIYASRYCRTTGHTWVGC